MTPALIESLPRTMLCEHWNSWQMSVPMVSLSLSLSLSLSRPAWPDRFAL